MLVKKMPRILALHLKRFKYQEQLQRLTKLNYRVAFTTEMRLYNTVSGLVLDVWGQLLSMADLFWVCGKSGAVITSDGDLVDFDLPFFFFFSFPSSFTTPRSQISSSSVRKKKKKILETARSGSQKQYCCFCSICSCWFYACSLFCRTGEVFPINPIWIHVEVVEGKIARFFLWSKNFNDQNFSTDLDKLLAKWLVKERVSIRTAWHVLRSNPHMETWSCQIFDRLRRNLSQFGPCNAGLSLPNEVRLISTAFDLCPSPPQAQDTDSPERLYQLFAVVIHCGR